MLYRFKMFHHISFRNFDFIFYVPKKKAFPKCTTGITDSTNGIMLENKASVLLKVSKISKHHRKKVWALNRQSLFSGKQVSVFLGGVPQGSVFNIFNF